MYSKIQAIEYLKKHSEYADEWSGARMWVAVVKVLESEGNIERVTFHLNHECNTRKKI